MTLLAIPVPADWDLDLQDLADDYADDGPGSAGALASGPDVVAPDPAALAAVGLDERTALLDAYVRGELGRVLHVAPGSIDVAGRTMNSLGVGSINGLELQARMEAALGLEVDLQRLLRANSAAELIDCLAGQLGPEDSPHKSAARRGTGTRAAAA
ncbi:acyl carrier protein [Streptomyces roseoverticillatus]|uniref:acyl carrier protein n=1 Tax=Streptomyces roseoverticillatus TaxID=66429 RepID=UPI0033C9EBA3